MNGLAKWKAVVYLAAIFLAGGVSGFFVAGKMEKQKAAKPLDTQQITKEVTVSFRDRCHARLNLTPAQAKKIDGIIERFSARIVATHEEKRARIHQICEERNSLILAELSPAQKETFEQMARERREAWRNKEGAHAKAPGPDRKDQDKADCGTNGPGPSSKLGVTGAIPDGLESQKPEAPR
jgi:hypothetical protein